MAAGYEAATEIAIGPPGTTFKELTVKSLTRMCMEIVEDKYIACEDLKIYFVGDVNGSQTRGYGEAVTAAIVLAQLLRAAPRLKKLYMHNFQYHVFREDMPVPLFAELFTDLSRFPSGRPDEPIPAVEQLVLQHCVILNDDMRAICPALPNLKRVEFLCCSGFSEATFTDAIPPYVEYHLDNDDSWYPEDGQQGLKNADAYCGGPVADTAR